MLDKILSHINRLAKVLIISFSALSLAFMILFSVLSFSRNEAVESFRNLLSGNTVAVEEIEEEIPYLTQQTEDSSLAEGATQTKQEGVNGKKKIYYKVLRDKNSKELKRTVINEETITPAIDKIIAIGTKKPYTPPDYTYTDPIPTEQNDTPTSSRSIYYCKSRSAFLPNNIFYKMYTKQLYPCGTRPPRYADLIDMIQATQEEFYAADYYGSFNSKNGQDGILEIRRKMCGYYQGGEIIYPKECLN